MSQEMSKEQTKDAHQESNPELSDDQLDEVAGGATSAKTTVVDPDAEDTSRTFYNATLTSIKLPTADAK